KKDIMKQWKKNSDELEGEAEIYVRIFDDFKIKLAELIQELDLPADTTVVNYTLMTALKQWAKTKLLDGSCFENIEDVYLYWKENINKIKERFSLTFQNEEKFKLRKAIFYGNWQNIGYGKLVKGETEKENL